MKPLTQKLLSCLILLSACSAPKSTPLKVQKQSQLIELQSDFMKKAESLLKNIKDKNNTSKLLLESKKLGDVGLKFIGEFSKNNVNCENFLNIVTSHYSKMISLNPEELDTIMEPLYHKSAAFPKTEAICTEVKEFIVHPATVHVYAKKTTLSNDDYLAMEAEIDELLSHSSNIEELEHIHAR